jgi:hypothetical protein
MVDVSIHSVIDLGLADNSSTVLVFFLSTGVFVTQYPEEMKT